MPLSGIVSPPTTGETAIYYVRGLRFLTADYAMNDTWTVSPASGVVRVSARNDYRRSTGLGIKGPAVLVLMMGRRTSLPHTAQAGTNVTKEIPVLMPRFDHFRRLLSMTRKLVSTFSIELQKQSGHHGLHLRLCRPHTGVSADASPARMDYMVNQRGGHGSSHAQCSYRENTYFESGCARRERNHRSLRRRCSPVTRSLVENGRGADARAAREVNNRAPLNVGLSRKQVTTPPVVTCFCFDGS